MNKRQKILKKHCQKHAIPMRFTTAHLTLLDLACTHKSYSYRGITNNNSRDDIYHKQSLIQKLRSVFLRIFRKFHNIVLKHNGNFTHSKLYMATAQFTNTAKNNEQLEFLGDAILNTIMTEYLLWRFPHKLEGVLSRIKAYVVSRDALYHVAAKLQLHHILKCDASIMHALPQNTIQAPLVSVLEKSYASYVYAPLANVVEALIGALYISRNMRVTRSFIIYHFAPIVNAVIEGTHNKDYKSMLQHYTQSTYQKKPIYTIVNITGAEHKKKYTAIVEIKDVNKTLIHTFRSIEAYNKKQAEQEAAKIACTTLKVQENDVLF